MPDWLSFLANVAAYAALGVGIVRYNLFDIELVLSRAVVYAGAHRRSRWRSTSLAVAALGSGSDGGVVPALFTAVAALASRRRPRSGCSGSSTG